MAWTPATCRAWRGPAQTSLRSPGSAVPAHRVPSTPAHRRAVTRTLTKRLLPPAVCPMECRSSRGTLVSSSGSTACGRQCNCVTFLGQFDENAPSLLTCRQQNQCISGQANPLNSHCERVKCCSNVCLCMCVLFINITSGVNIKNSKRKLLR